MTPSLYLSISLSDSMGQKFTFGRVAGLWLKCEDQIGALQREAQQSPEMETGIWDQRLTFLFLFTLFVLKFLLFLFSYQKKNYEYAKKISHLAEPYYIRANLALLPLVWHSELNSSYNTGSWFNHKIWPALSQRDDNILDRYTMPLKVWLNVTIEQTPKRTFDPYENTTITSLSSMLDCCLPCILQLLHPVMTFTC